MAFKFIHAADIHLDSPLRGLEQYPGAPVSEIRGATRQALRNLVSLALDEHVAFVVIAGDLYDGDWKDYNTGLFFNEQMSKLGREDIRVFVVAGNHDAASKLTKQLRTMENVTFLPTRKPATEVVESVGVAIHGQGYEKPDLTADISAAFPEARPDLFNIGLLHTAADGRPGHQLYAPCTVAGLISKGYQYWALGHVHAWEVLNKDPWIVFPGCVQGRHARETGPKGCALVTVDDGDASEPELWPLDVVRWEICEVDVEGCVAAGSVVDRVREELERRRDACEGRMLAARLVLIGRCPAHQEIVSDTERWRSEIRSMTTDLGDVWVEKIRFETAIPVDLDALRSQDHPVGRLLRSIDEITQSSAATLELAEELADLRKKLPSELRSAAEPLDLGDAATLRAILEDVTRLLAGRLIAERGES